MLAPKWLLQMTGVRLSFRTAFRNGSQRVTRIIRLMGQRPNTRAHLVSFVSQAPCVQRCVHRGRRSASAHTATMAAFRPWAKKIHRYLYSPTACAIRHVLPDARCRCLVLLCSMRVLHRNRLTCTSGDIT